MPANAQDCPVNKIDSNVTGLAYAEERCIGVLPDGPVQGDRAGGIWRPLDPNEYDDFGGEVSMTVRDPITASRQRRKGIVTDLEASGGFNQDVTHEAPQRLLQGFFFADAREPVTTHPISDSTDPLVSLTRVQNTGIFLGTGGGSKVNVGDIVKLSNMTIPQNNITTVVTGVNGDTLTVADALGTEVGTDASTLQVVGFSFPSASLSLSSQPGNLELTRSSGSFVNAGYNVGQWIYITQDDTRQTGFANNGGYARVQSVEATVLKLQEPTWVVSSEVSTGSVQVFAGVFIRNEEDPSLIVRRSYQLERTLGQDNDGIQTEYITGAVADELTLNLTAADKMTADFSFMGLTNELRSGATGAKPGDRSQSIPEEDAFNTASDVFQMRLFVNDPLSVTPSSLYAKVMEASITITNNASGNKCIGSLGNFDITVGNFEVSGEIEAYFSTVAAIDAVRRNADVGMNVIAAKDNTGFVYDIPLLSLGGGRVSVEKDEPIKLPLDQTGAKNEMGFTLGATYFNYLPDQAMPTIN